MAIRDIFTHLHTSFTPRPLDTASAPNHRSSRTVSIASAKIKPARKVKAAKPPSHAWYEAEDRNLPSVSSF